MHACEAAELTEAFVHQLGVSFKRQGYIVLYQSLISHLRCFGQNFCEARGLILQTNIDSLSGVRKSCECMLNPQTGYSVCDTCLIEQHDAAMPPVLIT